MPNNRRLQDLQNEMIQRFGLESQVPLDNTLNKPALPSDRAIEMAKKISQPNYKSPQELAFEARQAKLEEMKRKALEQAASTDFPVEQLRKARELDQQPTRLPASEPINQNENLGLELTEEEKRRIENNR